MGKSKEVLKKNLDGEIVGVYYNAKECLKHNENLTIDVLRKIIVNGKSRDGFTYEYSGNFSDEKAEYENGFKCPYCNVIAKNYNGLAKHVMHAHKGITKEQLLADYYYNGERPTCKCGCGQHTSIIYDKKNHNQIKFADFCQGHQSRVHNNWGHNEQAKEKSAETRRKQFENGERTVWNKGTTWKETFSDEKIAVLMKMYENKERNKKISDFFKGRPKTEKHKQKLKEIRNTEEAKVFYRDLMSRRIREGEFGLSSQLEKDFIENFIKPLGLEYTTQYYLKDIHQYCDVYIPSLNAVVECDGSFWHCDERLFPDGPKYDYQKRKILLDEKKNNYCKEHGIKCIRIWEYDILKHPEEVRERLKNELLIE